MTASDSAASELLDVLLGRAADARRARRGNGRRLERTVRALGHAVDLLPDAPVMAELSLAAAFGSARLTPATDRLIDELGDDEPWQTMRAGLEAVRADWKRLGGS